MTRKPTMEQYEELGREMSFLCNRISSLSCQLGCITGVSKKPYKLAREASRQLDRAKSEAEELLFTHCPQLGREGIQVFYGEIQTPADLQSRDPSDPQDCINPPG